MATDATFVTNVDLSNNELRNAKAQVLASDPTGVEGKFIYNSVDKQLKFYNGTAWVSGGAAVANLTGQASAFGQSASNGSASTAARSDHYHALPAHNAAAHSSIKLSDLAAPSANVAMGGNKLTGLAAGSANGDAVRYEQVVGVYQPLDGDLTAIAALATNGYARRTGTNAWTIDSTIPQASVTSLTTDLAAKVAGPASATDNAVVRFDATTGKLVQNSGVTISDTNVISGLANGSAASDAVNKSQLDTKANTSHSHAISDVTSLQTTLDAKAPLVSPPLSGTPTAPTASAGTNTTQIATTAFVQAAVSASAAGLDVKESVRVATTANITLSGTQTIDGVAVVAGNRVLVKNQSTASGNGIYMVAAGAWSRATDFDTSAEATSGAFTFVEEGTTNGGSGWVLSTANPITLGTTALTFTQFSGAGAFVWGDGLTNDGNTIHVDYDGGQGLGLTGALKLGVDRNQVPYKYAETLSTSATSYVITHNLYTRDITVAVWQVGSPYGKVEAAWEATSTATATVYFATAPTANTLRVVIHG